MVTDESWVLLASIHTYVSLEPTLHLSDDILLRHNVDEVKAYTLSREKIRQRSLRSHILTKSRLSRTSHQDAIIGVYLHDPVNMFQIRTIHPEPVVKRILETVFLGRDAFFRIAEEQARQLSMSACDPKIASWSIPRCHMRQS